MSSHSVFRILVVEASGVNAEMNVQPPGGIAFEYVHRSVDDFIDVLRSYADSADQSLSERIHEEEYDRAVRRFVERLGRFNLIFFHEEAWMRTDEFVSIYEAITAGEVLRYVYRNDGTLEYLGTRD